MQLGPLTKTKLVKVLEDIQSDLKEIRADMKLVKKEVSCLKKDTKMKETIREAA